MYLKDSLKLLLDKKRQLKKKNYNFESSWSEKK